MEIELIPQTTVNGFEKDFDWGIYQWSGATILTDAQYAALVDKFPLQEDTLPPTYIDTRPIVVVWDGTRYETIVYKSLGYFLFGDFDVCMGKPQPSVPFIIGFSAEQLSIWVVSGDTRRTHSFAVYEVVESDAPEETEPIGFIEYLVKPKYRMGNPFRGFFGWRLARKRQNGEAEEPAKVYGVEWDYSQSSTKLARTDNALEFANPAPATTLAEVGTSPFDNVLPWSGMKRETIGTDEMVYIPEFYFRVEDDQNNQKIRWKITSKPKDGFALHPGSGRYISRYHTSAGYASVSGAMPIGGLTRATFRTNSHAKGANWWMNDVATWSALQILYLVEFADWNCQTALGRGQTSGSIIATGGTDTAAYHTVKRDGASHQYRWIENPYSNIRDWLDGSVNVSNRVYVGTDNAVFGDTTAGYTDTGLTIPASTSAYPTRLGISEAAPWMFIPVQGGGSGNTYIPDLSIGGSSTTLRVTGGKCTYSAEWGLFKYDSNDPVGFTATDVGARLIYIPEGE